MASVNGLLECVLYIPVSLRDLERDRTKVQMGVLAEVIRSLEDSEGFNEGLLLELRIVASPDHREDGRVRANVLYTARATFRPDRTPKGSFQE